MKKYQNLYEVSPQQKDPGSLANGKNRYPEQAIAGPVDDYKNVPEEGLYYAFLGHSSIFLKWNGKTFLIDPVFSEYIGPFEKMGLRRYKGPRVSGSDFGPIDAVLITHNHYDHMDLPTLKSLADKTGSFIVPVGNKKLLMKKGIDEKKILEMDWGQSFCMDDIRISCTPAHHNSTRILLDVDLSQWCSYVIEDGNYRVFHSGDTAYSPHFMDIHASFPEFDLVFMECGQYNGAWHSSHMFPEESMDACNVLNARFAVPIHWGAYSLSPHSFDEPIRRFDKLAREKGISYEIPAINKVIRFR